MIKNRLTDPELLKDFNVEGYQFRQTMSDDLTWVFTRD
jgi:cytoplasmic iron level regulating protein YaaA (DUF328/UPF0246 family)